MERILLAYGLPKETVAAIMKFYKNTKVKVCSLDGDRLVWHCSWCSARGHISPISVLNLPTQRTSNIDRSYERKWLYTKKGKKQTIHHTYYYGWGRLHRWHSASCKFPDPNRIPAALSGVGSRWHWAPCKCRQKGVHVFLSKRRHLYTKLSFSEIRGQIHLPRKQRFTYWKWQYVTSEGIDCYR